MLSEYYCVDEYLDCKRPSKSTTRHQHIIFQALPKRGGKFMFHTVMAYHILLSLAMLALLMIPPFVSPTTFSYPAVFNFGDSNSDSGGLVAGMGEQLDPPNGQTFFKKPSGRFCDGRLIIDFLSTYIILSSTLSQTMGH